MFLILQTPNENTNLWNSLYTDRNFYTRKKLQPTPQVSHTKKEIAPTVKSDQGMSAKYSDDHLIVTSNMQERLKLFDKKNN